MINKKAGLSALISAALIWQCAFAAFAGWEPDAENTYDAYSTDFSDYVPGEIVGDKQLNQPAGWTFEKSNSSWELKAYADIVTDSVGSMPGVPYLRLYNNGEQKLSESIRAKKEFELPDEGVGIVRTKFRYSTNHGNYAAGVGITDSNGKGVNISSGWAGSWETDGGAVDGESQTTYGSGQWRLFVSDLLGTGNSGNFSIGTASGSDDFTWRNFEVVVNTSEEKLATEIAGQNITLGGRVYAVAMTSGGATNILKGNLRLGTGKLCNFTLSTPGWFQGSEVRLDDVSVEYTPIIYIDNRFTNRVTVKNNGTDVSVPGDIGTELTIENKLMNKSLTDKDAVILTALYRNGYMINSAAGFAEKVPHSVTGDENIFKNLDMTFKTPSEDIFGNVELKIFTLDSYDKIGARCGAFVISENSQSGTYTSDTTNPAINEQSNTLSYSGTNEPETNVTYAVVKSGKELASAMKAEDFSGALYYFGETKSDKSGKYVFDIKFAGENSEYTLLVNDGGTLKKYPIIFQNKLAENLTGRIGSAQSADELKTMLDLYLEAVMFSNSLYNRYINEIKSGNELYNNFYNEMKNNPVSSGEEILKLVKICTLIYGLNKENDTADMKQVLENNADLFDLERIYSKDLYSDSILTDENVKQLVFDKFAKCLVNDRTLFDNVEKFHNTFGDAVILAICEKTVGSAFGKKIIETINSHSGADDAAFSQTYKTYSGMNETKRSVIEESIMGKSYSDTDAIKTAFQTATAKQINQSQSGGGTGGGESTGGGKGTTVMPSGSGNSTQRPALQPNREPALTPPEYKLPAKGEAVSFSDLNNAPWAENFIVKLSERGIVSGDENGKFNPNKTVSREEFVTMLVKLLGIDTLYVGSGFDDVPADAWYYEYVSAAYEKGIVSGTDNNSFGSGQNITREDMCVMIYRALKTYGVYIQEAECEKFSDDESLSGYARDGVYALKKLGAADGFSDGTFAPGKYASRAESAKILSVILDYLETESNTADAEVSNK